MLSALKYIVALAIAGLVAGCGGGSETPTLSPQRMKAAQAPMASTASVSASAAAELLLTAAEAAYPQFFPGPQTTQSFGSFAFRYYPQTNMYLGVVISADAHYTLHGVYVVGNGFGTLDNPGYQGLMTSFISVDIGGGTTTGHTLTITGTVNTQGQSFAIPTTTLTNVPAPNTQLDFCSGLANDTTFSQLTNSGTGSMTITNCTFNGTSGNISATLTITTSTPVGNFTVMSDFSITYTYQ